MRNKVSSRVSRPLTIGRVVRALGAVTVFLSCSAVSFAHPMGNFSISHYAGIRIQEGYLELHYILDEAEIPTFQEMQRTGLVPNPGDPSVVSYLSDQAEAFKTGLRLELDGNPLTLETVSTNVIFPAGAGGLPTMKLGFLYRASLRNLQNSERHQLHYRDNNFRDRAGWKEIVATPVPNITVVDANVSAADHSQQLTNYPTDLTTSPPQQLEAEVAFVFTAAAARVTAHPLSLIRPTQPAEGMHAPATSIPQPAGTSQSAQSAQSAQPGTGTPLALKANQQATPRSAFTELMRTRELSFSIVLFAAMVALGLGGLHALEPGHGKTLVAAYLVGSQGTAVHALLLGLIVTVSHTAGVFLLGAITLYAQKYVVPEQLYPWLGVISGLTISLLGLYLLLQRYLGFESGQLFSHSHGGYRHGGFGETPSDGITFPQSDGTASATSVQAVPFRQLLALGITGGMIPCPAALVVLLSAVALHRVGFGLFLIVVFSAGLAAVLIATGLLVVYSGRFLARLHAEGPLIRRWLPLASAAAVTALGFAIALRALLSAGFLQMRL
jgi:ABC-type nickel/cobalt efflux system permease component RcnA